MKLWTYVSGMGCLLFATAVFFSCRTRTSSTAIEAPWFEEVAQGVGLDFIHDPGPVDGKYFMPQIMGSGAALFDFDGDGLLDVYLLNNGGPKGASNRLYKQQTDGTFEDVSKGSGLDFSGYCMGVAIGDVNNDGRPDVLVTEYGGIRLFLNNGNGTFTEITKEAGLTNLLWGVSAAFVDYDRDGWLDLVVVTYIDYDPSWPCPIRDGSRDYCSPNAFIGTASRLYRNVSKGLAAKAGAGQPRAQFIDVSLPSGIGHRASSGLGVLCADFDGDGWPDLFITNDGLPNHLWINQKNGKFREQAVPRGVAVNAMGQAESNMGIAWGDIDGDGLQDLFVTHLGIETNTLWKQGPRGQFRDVTGHSRMSQPAWRATGFGTMLGDFDNDGSLDAILANGRVIKGPRIEDCKLGAFFSQYAERNQLFQGDGTGRFRDISPHNQGRAGLSGIENIGRSLATGDLRNDGSLGVLISGVGGPARLYRNIVPRRGHWLVVRVLDDKSKRDALGAEVTVTAGGQRWVRTAQSAGSYLSSNDPRPHFGLGSLDRIDSIEVLWPDGKPEESREVFPGGLADRHVVLVRGKGQPVK